MNKGNYSQEFKEAVLKRLLPPENATVIQLANEYHIHENTLRYWCKKAGLTPARERKPHTPKESSRTLEEKFNMLMETCIMSELERGEYCRAHGIHSEDLTQWRHEFITPAAASQEQTPTPHLVEENRQLRRELNRKEKALAEMAALLTLSKKAQAIWGEREDGK